MHNVNRPGPLGSKTSLSAPIPPGSCCCKLYLLSIVWEIFHGAIFWDFEKISKVMACASDGSDHRHCCSHGGVRFYLWLFVVSTMITINILILIIITIIIIIIILIYLLVSRTPCRAPLSGGSLSEAPTWEKIVSCFIATTFKQVICNMFPNTLFLHRASIPIFSVKMKTNFLSQMRSFFALKCS